MIKHNFTTTLILLGLVIVITSAAPTVDDEIVPEADFIQSEEGAEHRFRTYSKISSHGKLKGSIDNLNKEIKEKSAAAKKANENGRKEDADDSTGTGATGAMGRPLCSSLKRDAKVWEKYKGKTYATHIECRCKGGKVPAFLKEPSKKDGVIWNKKFNGDAANYGGPDAKACWIEYGKKSGMANPDTKPCPRDGRSYNDECSPPPKPKKKYTPKKCTCKIDNGWGSKTFSTTGKALKLKPGEWNKKKSYHLFRGITCTGCKYVKIADDDPGTFFGGHPQDWLLGRNDAAAHAAKGDARMEGAHGDNKSCCGKKTCSITDMRLGQEAYDIKDDVSSIIMEGAC